MGKLEPHHRRELRRLRSGRAHDASRLDGPRLGLDAEAPPVPALDRDHAGVAPDPRAAPRRGAHVGGRDQERIGEPLLRTERGPGQTLREVRGDGEHAPRGDDLRLDPEWALQARLPLKPPEVLLGLGDHQPPVAAHTEVRPELRLEGRPRASRLRVEAVGGADVLALGCG